MGGKNVVEDLKRITPLLIYLTFSHDKKTRRRFHCPLRLLEALVRDAPIFRGLVLTLPEYWVRSYPLSPRHNRLGVKLTRIHRSWAKP